MNITKYASALLVLAAAAGVGRYTSPAVQCQPCVCPPMPPTPSDPTVPVSPPSTQGSATPGELVFPKEFVEEARKSFFP